MSARLDELTAALDLLGLEHRVVNGATRATCPTCAAELLLQISPEGSVRCLCSCSPHQVTSTLAATLAARNGDQTGQDDDGGEPENVAKSGGKGSDGAYRHIPPHIPGGSLSFPRPLGEAAYCGLAGEIVREIEPHSEADPAAILVSLLTMFGNAIGRGPCFQAGDAEHATNLFACIVGDTSSGRKGTSAEGHRRLMVAADESWRRCLTSGLVSGEGVIHHVRDARSVRRAPGKGETPDLDGLVEELADAGVDDKRLMVLVPEFAQVLGVIARRDNTLSAVIRDLWDRGDAQTLAKNSPERTTGSLVSILAHVTPVELRSRLDSTVIGNGFANRFMFVASKRSKLLPRGGNIPPDVIASLSAGLGEALGQARNLREVEMEPEAWQLWDGLYEGLTTPPPGLVGSITGRGAPMVRRIALLYALMDGRSSVHEDHLLAGVEVWRYEAESVRWVFGDRLGEALADDCLGYLREAGQDGLTRSDLRELLGHRTSSRQTTDALWLLAAAGLARCVEEPTGGRSAKRWFAIEGTAETGR